MAVIPHNTGDTDPHYWDERFDKIERKLQTFQATCVRNSADAAAKVAREAATVAGEVRQDLVNEMAAVKKIADSRAASVQQQLADINTALTKLASAKLLQQCLAGVMLGCLFTAIVKVLGG